MAVTSPPAWILGAWRRRARSIGGRAMREVSEVLWVQAGPYFADLRQPKEDHAESVLDRAQAFSGSISVEGTTVTWSHDLDSLGRPSGYEDTAEVEAGSAGLVERGPGYVEVWQREGEALPAAVLERRYYASRQVAARVVAVADLSIVVWGGRSPGGAAVRYAAGGWQIEAQVGPGTVPWPAVAAARSGCGALGWQRVA